MTSRHGISRRQYSEHAEGRRPAVARDVSHSAAPPPPAERIVTEAQTTEKIVSHKRNLYEYLHKKRRHKGAQVCSSGARDKQVCSSGAGNEQADCGAKYTHQQNQRKSSARNPSKHSTAFVNPLVDLQLQSTESGSDQDDVINLLDSSDHSSSVEQPQSARRLQASLVEKTAPSALKENVAPPPCMQEEQETRNHIRRNKQHIRAMKQVAKWIRQQQQQQPREEAVASGVATAKPTVSDTQVVVVKHEHHHYYHFHHYRET